MRAVPWRPVLGLVLFNEVINDLEEGGNEVCQRHKVI